MLSLSLRFFVNWAPGSDCATVCHFLLACIFCVFLLRFWVQLPIPVQLIAWKDSSPEWTGSSTGALNRAHVCLMQVIMKEHWPGWRRWYTCCRTSHHCCRLRVVNMSASLPTWRHLVNYCGCFSCCCCRFVYMFPLRHLSASPPVDSIRAVVIVWRLGGKIIRTLLCCVVYNSCAQWCTHMLV